MSPGAEELGGRAAAVPDESVAAGEADLAAVGVSAEHEVEAIAACLVVDFGAVREKDAAGARRDTVAGGFEIVGAVEVRVIGAGDPELLAVVFDRDIFVEEDAESGLFEMRDDFDDVVVAEDGEGAGLEGGGDAADVAHVGADADDHATASGPCPHRKATQAGSAPAFAWMERARPFVHRSSSA